MQVSSVKEENKLTVAISGKVDTKTAPELEAFINENTEGISQLVLDLAETIYISSAGLRTLIKVHKKMSNVGSMKIINVSSDVMEIFDMIGFSNIFTIE